MAVATSSSTRRRALQDIPQDFHRARAGLPRHLGRLAGTPYHHLKRRVLAFAHRGLQQRAQ